MNFQESVKTCFSKYADFNGTASLPEYWWFALFLFVGNLVISAVSPMLSVLFALGTILPAIAAAARRLHETQRSGWWQLIALIPVVGWIVLIFLLAQPAKTADAS